MLSQLIDTLESRLLFARPYGVDVSYYQTSNGTTNIINWTNAKNNSAIEFAMIRSSYGNVSADTAFASQAAAAKAAGILVGAYHYAYPESAADAITEANNFMNRASGYMGIGNLPPVLDMEDETSPLTNAQLTTWANDFCNHIYNTIGVKPYIYCNTNWATNILGSSVSQWPLWIANYNYNSTHQTANPPTGVWGSGNWKFFQYTSTGSISGYTGNIDRNVFNGTSAQLLGEAILDREVTVSLLGANIADGQATSIDFGAVNQGGSTVSKTFTVKNDGDLLLTLSNLSVPAGYTITSPFGDTTLRSGESTTFTVRLDASISGTKSGNIQFSCNDSNEATFNFPVTGVVNGLASPSGLQVTGFTYNSASLQWVDNSGSETSFKIERKSGVNGTFAEVGSVNANATTFNDTNAPGGSILYYRVRASDGSQFSGYSNEVTVTTPVQTPPNVLASSNLYDKVAVSFDAAAGATSYQIFRGTTNDVNSASFLVSTAQTSYDDTSALGNVQYYYFVRGVSAISTASIFSAGAMGVRLVDSAPPSVLASEFLFETAPQRVQFSFSEDVGGSVDLSDLTFVRLSDSTEIQPSQVSYSAQVATWHLPAGLLDGNYLAVIAGVIRDLAQNPLPGNPSLGFFLLSGDANRDRKVNTSDFNRLAGNFGLSSGATLSMGDFSLDGAIDSIDFALMQSRFGVYLPAPAPSPFGAGLIGDDPGLLIDL